MTSPRAALVPVALLLALAVAVPAQQAFVNFETPHVHPLDRTPDGSRVLAVNTPDARLEIFDASGAGLVRLPSIPVGLDPVSVRARTDTEVWVVNQLSDSVSIVDLPTGRVRATLDTDDEPCDVVFAGSPQRAFVSCSQANTVLVFDPADLGIAPITIAIDAEDPRAMAVSPDGGTVYVAVFESGNASTVLGGGLDANLDFPPNVVSDNAGPYGGTNPPPNDGAVFTPPQKPGNPAPPRVSLIVKQDAAGQWMDDNGGNWTSLVSGAQADKSGRPVGWTLPDRDVAMIDANTLSVSWITRLMNINMALAVRPNDGHLAVVGTDATNEIRFEPVLKGRFLRVQVALTDAGGGSKSVLDLNDHLTYAVSLVPQAERDKSIGDPRGVVWNASGTRAYVAGMGSNNVVVIDAAGTRAGLAPTIEVGEGPTGVVLDAAGARLFVLNKFDSSVSIVSTTTELETSRVGFHDASPPAVKTGRKHLYDTHANSGLGQISCGSCHVDARMDRLAWDLGDPAGDVAPVAGNNLGAGIPGLAGGFEDFHPMKGPMLTQTLQDIIGKEPHHWRADRKGLEDFGGAFLGLQGDDTTLTAQEMQEFEDFLGTIHFPPNPFRNLDNTLPTNLPLSGHFTTGRFAPEGQPLPDGDAVNGLALYRPPTLLDGVACVTCHTLPTGMGTDYEAVGPTFTTLVQIPPGPNGERHHALVAVDGATNVSIKIPHLRNLYDRTGFNTTQSSNRSGAGVLHDGSVDSVERFVSEPVFAVTSDQDVADLTAFMLAFSGSDLPAGSTSTLALEPPGTASQDAHAAVGTQTTLLSLGGAPAQQVALIGSLLSLANAGRVGLLAKGIQAGEARGWRYDGAGTWQSDRAAESLGTAALEALAAPGSELTFTAVPSGSETRLGVDRDLDGVFDRDELDACSDPGNPLSLPGDWTDLGSGLAGTHGVPALSGCGSLLAGDTVTLSLSGALENTTAHLFIGATAVNLPFKGGTLVPSLDLTLLFLPTGGSGALELSGPMAPGLPPGFTLFFQYWVDDPAGPVAFAASNAVRGVTP
ncbi:MAG: YncE family protein [Planctomycetota bacterium]|jgi:YVTN family beta-propeller protein